MSHDDIKQVINEYLAKTGATDVVLKQPDDNTIVANFNAKDLISLKVDIPGWVYTGVQLNPEIISDEPRRLFRIKFSKVS